MVSVSAEHFFPFLLPFLFPSFFTLSFRADRRSGKRVVNRSTTFSFLLSFIHPYLLPFSSLPSPSHSRSSSFIRHCLIEKSLKKKKKHCPRTKSSHPIVEPEIYSQTPTQHNQLNTLGRHLESSSDATPSRKPNKHKNTDKTVE